MARVFISHATPDVAIATQVRDWLDHDHETFLEVHPEDGIQVGEAWRERLHDELRKADAVVCVVSSASIASSWCTAEVAIADALGCLLLPVQTEGVIHPLIGHLNHIPHSTAREHLEKALRQFDAGGRKLAKDQEPFPGLDAFTTSLSAVFFGRDQETRALARKVRRGPGLLTVVGPSGCGKSSLVRAGLLAQLADDPRWLVMPPWLPGNDPLDALSRAVRKTAERAGHDWSLQEARDRLVLDGLHGVAQELVDEDRRLLITIDQAEELFTRAGEKDRQVLANLLREGLGDSVRVIATLRSEFLDDLRALPELGGVHIGSYVLAPLAREVLNVVITGPAKVAGLKVHPELVAQLVEDTASGEALPLLAFTLQHLAMNVPRGGTLSSERYENLGGVHGALARHADDVLDSAVSETGLCREELLSRLAALATLDLTGRPTRKRVNLAQVDETAQKALEVFVRHRLLTASGDKQGRWIGVAHEALFTEWRPLRSAIDERQIGLRAAQSVELDASQWIEGASADHLLLNEDTFAAIEPLVSDDDLTPDARRYLATSRVRIRALQGQRRRDRRRTVSWLAVFLAAAVGAAGLAAIQWRTASVERDTATARALVAQAQVARNSSPQLALRLGMAAHELAPSSDTNTELVNTLLTTRYGGSFGETVSAVAFGPTGHTAVVGSTDGTASLWDLTDKPRRLTRWTGSGAAITSVALSADIAAIGSSDGSVLVQGTGKSSRQHRLPPGPPVTSVAFDRTGTLLAIGRSDGTTALWSVVLWPTPLGEPFKRQGVGVSSVAFSGSKIATGSHDGTVVVWDITDPSHPVAGEPLTDHVRKAVTAVAFNGDGTLLATGGSDGVTTLFRLADRTHTRIPGHSGVVSSVAFSPASSVLAAGSHDATTVLWDISSPSQPRQLGDPLVGQRSAVSSLAFSPDGLRLVTGSPHSPAIVWEMADRPRRIGLPLTGHGMLVKSVAFEDGNTLVTTGSDNRQIRWDVGYPQQPRRISEGTAASRLYSLALHGTMDATAGSGNTVVLWDISTRKPIGKPLTGHNNSISAAAFSFDGKVLAAGSTDGTTILWNIADPGHPLPIGQPLGQNKQVTALAFSPDGTKLAAGTSTGSTLVWDVTDPNQPRQVGRQLDGHRMTVNSAAFAPNGTVLATAGSDGTTVLWDMALLDNAVARACAVAGGGLSPLEWRQYLPALAYRDTCAR
ncbi:TIR domain-containing protein [Lentzea sp. BCCO 10_0856]|uniref:TIR domain-containing protein n=1 Tax=Lentzea miocenica TaxID=3095431 RepID=A0ABU4T8K0_9PSEU|nr:TIR domain-containing protein [Lentzea sp. BCCO 10_0856]MDX8034486.1 TIR domain-containing protein [Lentzea sp. BCCO 10_0856]